MHANSRKKAIQDDGRNGKDAPRRRILLTIVELLPEGEPAVLVVAIHAVFKGRTLGEMEKKQCNLQGRGQ